jgi:hypothetical protein
MSNHLLVHGAEDNNPTDTSILSSRRRSLQIFPRYVLLFVLSLHHLLVVNSSIEQSWDVIEQARWAWSKTVHIPATLNLLLSETFWPIFGSAFFELELSTSDLETDL